jgi:hypothetical protein
MENADAKMGPELASRQLRRRPKAKSSPEVQNRVDFRSSIGTRMIEKQEK